MASRRRRRPVRPRSQASVIGEDKSDHFFKQGEQLTDEFLPETGDPSLYKMPWIGIRGDWKDEPQPPSLKPKIIDRKHYVRMDLREKTTEEESSTKQAVCESCGSVATSRCGCCRHFRGHKAPSRAADRKESGARPQSLPKRFRQIESMAMAAFEAEKLGRRLALAASMFAAGFAMGSMSSKWGNDRSDDDEEDEEEESEE